MRPKILVLCALIALGVPFGARALGTLAQPGRATILTNPADFRAFYCASRVFVRGADPYRTEPLRSCEHRTAEQFGLEMFPALVLPAPLPPYALALFAPLAMLPFPVAGAVWLAALVLSFSGAVLLTATLARRNPVLAFLVLLGPLAYVSIPLGQPMPVVVALLCIAAVCMRREHAGAAAACCALATIEPHVGAPAVVALFAGAIATRRYFAWMFVAVGSASLLLAPAVNLEYVRSVLPVHALSQVGQFEVQYSLTTLLAALGASVSVALAAGTAWYGAMVVLGVVVAVRLARRFDDRALLVLVPPAFAVIGGTFIHLAQIAVAVPALVVLSSHLRGAVAHRVAIVALTLLAIPWGSIADAPIVGNLLWSHAVAPRPVPVALVGERMLADAGESVFMQHGGYGSNGGSFLTEIALKLPTWFALLSVAGLGIVAARPLDVSPGTLRRELVT